MIKDVIILLKNSLFSGTMNYNYTIFRGRGLFGFQKVDNRHA